jgi:hypothetical protein
MRLNRSHGFGTWEGLVNMFVCFAYFSTLRLFMSMNFSHTTRYHNTEASNILTLHLSTCWTLPRSQLLWTAPPVWLLISLILAPERIWPWAGWIRFLCIFVSIIRGSVYLGSLLFASLRPVKVQLRLTFLVQRLTWFSQTKQKDSSVSCRACWYCRAQTFHAVPEVSGSPQWLLRK